MLEKGNLVRTSRSIRESRAAVFCMLLVLLLSPFTSSACEIDFPKNSKADQHDELAKDLAFKFRQFIGSNYSGSSSPKIQEVNHPFFSDHTQYPTSGNLADVGGEEVGNVAVIILLKDGTARAAIYAHSKVDGFAYSHIATHDIAENQGFAQRDFAHPEKFPAWVLERARNSVSEKHSEPLAIDLFYQHLDSLGSGDAGWNQFFSQYDDLRFFTERPPCGTYCAVLVDNLRTDIKTNAESRQNNDFKFGVSHNYDRGGTHLLDDGATKKFSNINGKLKWINQRAANPSSGLTRTNTAP